MANFCFCKIIHLFFTLGAINLKKIHNTKVNTQYTVDLCILWNQPASTGLVTRLTFELSMAQCSYTLKTRFNALSYRSTKVYGKLSCLADTNTLRSVSMNGSGAGPCGTNYWTQPNYIFLIVLLVTKLTFHSNGRLSSSDKLKWLSSIITHKTHRHLQQSPYASIAAQIRSERTAEIGLEGYNNYRTDIKDTIKHAF